MRNKIDKMQADYRTSFLKWFHDHEASVQPLFRADKGSGTVESYIDDYGVDVIDGLYLDLLSMAESESIIVPAWGDYSG